jgi:hypothetical protein
MDLFLSFKGLASLQPIRPRGMQAFFQAIPALENPPSPVRLPARWLFFALGPASACMAAGSDLDGLPGPGQAHWPGMEKALRLWHCTKKTEIM